MYYAEYNNSIEEDELSLKLKKDYQDNHKYLVNEETNVKPSYHNYYNPQAGFCNMSFGGLINQSKTSTIVIPVNADLEYDNDCKMGYNTTLLIPLTIPVITENSSVIIIPVVTQQKIDKDNKNIISTTTQQPILEAKIENNKISVKEITNIPENSQIVTSVTNINENHNKLEATTITTLPVKSDENKKIVTESNVINTDVSGSNVKTDTNISITQTCLNGSLQCDVVQQINNIKSDDTSDYTTYTQSSRTIVDLSSGEINLYGKNDMQNITTIPTNFIDLSNNNLDMDMNQMPSMPSMDMNQMQNMPSMDMNQMENMQNMDMNQMQNMDMNQMENMQNMQNMSDMSNNNVDMSNNIMLSNDDNSFKISIPVDAPTIIKVDISGEIINTTSEPIKINSKEPNTYETIIERFTLNNVEGYNVSTYVKNISDGTINELPGVNIPVFTKYT